MSTWARPGVKVVCVDAVSGRGCWRGDAPEKGAVYTILDVWADGEGDLILSLVELKRSREAHDFYGHRLGYAARRFRPLVTRTQEQDVALFRKIVADAPAGVDA